MLTKDFDFDLPKELIAQRPSEERGQSRLMVLERASGLRRHGKVADLPQILSEAGMLSPCGRPPLMVFNDSKVRKARLLGRSAESGAAAEFLLLEPLEAQARSWKVMVKKAARKKAGGMYVFLDGSGSQIASARITGEKAEGGFRFLQFDKPIDDVWLDCYGHVPLPAYIKREKPPGGNLESADDAERYQTVYAKNSGSVAAPTAGLHFTEEFLGDLAACGVDRAFITLHVGAGTFLPVRAQNIKDHVMHEERFIISEESACAIEKAKAEKRKIIAVGTTCIRCLESAWNSHGALERGERKTAIYIYPPFRFQVADALFTNFHTPQSTLIMLVSAFATREMILESYKEAVGRRYRFFSYGDAMLIK